MVLPSPQLLCSVSWCSYLLQTSAKRLLWDSVLFRRNVWDYNRMMLARFCKCYLALLFTLLTLLGEFLKNLPCLVFIQNIVATRRISEICKTSSLGVFLFFGFF